jgi:hypothetical protein
MSLRYKILFVAEVLHDYYASRQCKDFSIAPTLQTESFLQGHGLLYKMVGNKIIVLIKVDADDKPVISLDPGAKLSFYMQADHPHLYNFTNINYQPAQPNRYYFNNLNQAQQGSILHLSSGIHAYNNANAYAVGSFAANVSNDVFEAIKRSDNINPHDVSDAAYWVPKGKNQYVNENDLIEFANSLYQFPISADTNFTIKIFRLNIATGIYDQQVKDTEVQTFSAPQTSIQIKLHDLPAGKYRMQVNATSRDLYIDNTIRYNQVFGVIEIFNHLPATNAFSLFDVDGKSKQSTFTIAFANRSVIWKYRARTANVTAIKNGAEAFEVFTPKEYVSPRPIPLTQQPNNSISLSSSILGDIANIANPGNDRLNTIVKDGDEYYCAEKSLNY